MNTGLTIAIVSASLLLAAVAGLWSARKLAAPPWQIAATVPVEALALAVDAVAIYHLTVGDRPHDLATFIGYLIGLLLVLPFAAAIAVVERSHFGSLVLAVGGLVVPILIARLHQIYAVRGG